jgi:aryl-alcohol dehydrogenase-like predicted oxidoreductase
MLAGVSSLERTGLEVSRLGLGLAAIGRPGYITLGRAHDLGADRSPDALEARTATMLDTARDLGVRYVDAARSYGRAENFLGDWLRLRGIAPGEIAVGSKWGYRYTAEWRIDAAVHEQKQLSLARFRTQLAESQAMLGPWLTLYQIHSATAESGCFEDDALLAALVAERRAGTYGCVGLTLTGATAERALERALAARVDGERVFDVVQATFNCLEPSLGRGLATAHAEGLGVIAKEVHANGRLTDAPAAVTERPDDEPLRARLRALGDAAGLAIDQLAVAWVASHPFVDVVLSGAATVAQLRSHRAAVGLTLDAATLAELAALAEPRERYWETRASLPWR